MKNLYHANKDEVMADLDTLIQPVLDYIKKTWTTENLLPVNHQEYTEHLNSGSSLCDEFISTSEELSKTFTGLVNSQPGYADCPLHMLLSPHYTTYGQYDQGQTPLETFVTALIYYGMDLQKVRAKFASGADAEAKETAEEKNALLQIAKSELRRVRKITSKLSDEESENVDKSLLKLENILSLMRATKLQGVASVFQ